MGVWSNSVRCDGVSVRCEGVCEGVRLYLKLDQSYFSTECLHACSCYRLPQQPSSSHQA